MPETFKLTAEQLEDFERWGVIRSPGFYARDVIDTMADRVWADLERRFGLRRDRPETWLGAAPGRFQALKISGAFSGLRSPKMCDLADALLGEAWQEPQSWGHLLVTFPATTPRLARPPWHLDIGSVERLSPLPVLRVFTFLEPVLPSGGGTLYVAGSHRLAMDIEHVHGRPVRSAQVRERLKLEHPWFAHLLTASNSELGAFLDIEAQVGDHTVCLEEMTGAPGDLIIMHPAIMHGTAHNALPRPRIMLTEWVARGDARSESPLRDGGRV